MKYNHKGITADGIKFKSRLEWEVYLLLTELKKMGTIVSPIRYEKERFKIVEETEETLPNGKKKKHGPCYYTPDFIFDYNGKKIIIEVKGYATDIYQLRKKVFLNKYPIFAPTFFEIKKPMELVQVLEKVVGNDIPIF